MKNLTVLTVNVKSDYPKYLIESFEKYKPSDLNINYIVVENTNDISFKDDICSISTNIKWINNPIQNRHLGGSSANHADGLHCGMGYVEDDWVFICDNDTVVTNESFFTEFLNKVDEGYSLIGTSQDPVRIKAVFATGLMVKSDIAKKVDLHQKFQFGEQIWDTANGLTIYVKENELKYYIFRNTWNDDSLVDIINEPYKSLGKTCGIDRCLDSNNNVMFLHLGRGTAKFGNLYQKNGKKTYKNWVDFVTTEVLCEKI